MSETRSITSVFAAKPRLDNTLTPANLQSPLKICRQSLLKLTFAIWSITLAAEGSVSATVGVNPLVLTVSAPGQASVNQFFWVEARLKNRGETKITNTVTTIHVPEGLTLVTKAERNVGTLLPQKERSIRWRVRADEPGSYIILVSASGEYEGALIETQKTVIVQITESLLQWLTSHLPFKPPNLGRILSF